MVPGTGTTGPISFASNFIKIFTGSSYADPVWLNIPGWLLDDVQVNSEYVAYAINYIAGLTQQQVAVLAWSQGNIDTQWALKYWPSTIPKVRDFISMSADFHGTTTSDTVCPGSPLLPCAPALIQQSYDSVFIETLRSDGGDSAYVPTTSVFSASDQTVVPQSGTNASAYINDARGVGVLNAELQVVCADQPAGGYYPHEGVLYNALAAALAIDALQNDGPASLSRLDLGTVCSKLLADGLNLADIIGTEGEKYGPNYDI